MPVPGHCPWTGATHRQLLQGPAATQARVTPCITANTAARARRERARRPAAPRQCPSRACGAHVSPGRTLSPGLPEPPPHAAPTTAPGGHGAATLPTGPAATRRRCRASCTTPGARARGGPVAPPGGAVVLRPGARRDVISERTLKGKSQLREFSGWHICCSIPEIVPQRSGYLLYSHRQDDKLERTVTISLCELPPLF